MSDKPVTVCLAEMEVGDGCGEGHLDVMTSITVMQQDIIISPSDNQCSSECLDKFTKLTKQSIDQKPPKCRPMDPITRCHLLA